ncbi:MULTISPECIES: FAD-dependent oxidoreductase [Paenibacillus]|uniref:FAD-dependent oxidoreductase n=1 Tax=Paenibacillus TaxID=44249 RepID=UPI0022B8EA16|nr:FAD-dependent oxidoreductase [Paenibacillus caseinilyticus]MCZ8518134.1 FAD-dependent oxidoreductase [Paenibacillus caseinilyticus]
MSRRRAVALSSILMAGALLLTACLGRPGTTAVQSPKPLDPSKPDVVVIGSEIEGMYLARAAADEGLSVLVLDPREQPGGQLLQGEMLYLDEPFDRSGQSLLQGRVKGLFDGYKKGTIRKLPEYEAYFADLAEGITIISGITLTSLEANESGTSSDRIQPGGTAPSKITAMTYRTAGGEQKTVSAKYWVENTDHAALSSRLGLQRIPGMETVFTAKQNDYMASSVMMKFKGVDWKKFEKEVGDLAKDKRYAQYGGNTDVTKDFAYGLGNIGKSYKPTTKDVFLRGLNVVNQRDGEALINALLVFGVNPADAQSVKAAHELGMSETVKVRDHLRKELPGWEHAEVSGYPRYLYIRDYDRYETEYVLQASDLFSGTMFPDNVAVAGYALDLQGTKINPWGTEIGKPDRYGMPLRSFLYKGYSNVIAAGKNVGASAVAYGSARIQPNTAQAGEVIGTLLGQIDGKHELTSIPAEEMKRLQSVMEKQGITLTGKGGRNLIEGYTPEQIAEVNKGKVVVKPKS